MPSPGQSSAQAPRRLVLDSGGVLALARGDRQARLAVDRALSLGYRLVVPTVVVAEVHRGGRAEGRTSRVLNSINAFAPLDLDRAREAGMLLGAAGMATTVDAVVAAEALASVPSAVLTSDARDIRRLIDGQPGAERVAIVAV